MRLLNLQKTGKIFGVWYDERTVSIKRGSVYTAIEYLTWDDAADLAGVAIRKPAVKATAAGLGSGRKRGSSGV